MQALRLYPDSLLVHLCDDLATSRLCGSGRHAITGRAAVSEAVGQCDNAGRKDTPGTNNRARQQDEGGRSRCRTTISQGKLGMRRREGGKGSESACQGRG